MGDFEQPVVAATTSGEQQSSEPNAASLTAPDARGQRAIRIDRTLRKPTFQPPGSVFKMSLTPGDAARPAPFLGQHNSQVYSELLGYDSDTVERLQMEGVI